METLIFHEGLTYFYDSPPLSSKYVLRIFFDFANGDHYDEEQYEFDSLDQIESWYDNPSPEFPSQKDNGGTLRDHLKCLVAFDNMVADGTLSSDSYCNALDVANDWLEYGAPLFPHLSKDWHQGFARDLLSTYTHEEYGIGLICDWHLYWYDESGVRWTLNKKALFTMSSL